MLPLLYSDQIVTLLTVIISHTVLGLLIIEERHYKTSFTNDGIMLLHKCNNYCTKYDFTESVTNLQATAKQIQ